MCCIELRQIECSVGVKIVSNSVIIKTVWVVCIAVLLAGNFLLGISHRHLDHLHLSADQCQLHHLVLHYLSYVDRYHHLIILGNKCVSLLIQFFFHAASPNVTAVVTSSYFVCCALCIDYLLSTCISRLSFIYRRHAMMDPFIREPLPDFPPFPPRHHAPRPPAPAAASSAVPPPPAVDCRILVVNVKQRFVQLCCCRDKNAIIK